MEHVESGSLEIWALDGIEAGQVEILADEISRQVQGGLAGGVAALYPQFA